MEFGSVIKINIKGFGVYMDRLNLNLKFIFKGFYSFVYIMNK